MSLNPEQARIAISEAEARSQVRQVRQMRILIVALIALTAVAGFSAAGFFVAYGQARRNGETGLRVLQLTQTMADVQSQVVTATAIAQLATNRLLDCTTPEGKCAQEGQKQTGQAILTLNQAGAAGRQDLLRKVAELARAMGAPQAAVNRVLREPSPDDAFVTPTP